MGKEAVGGEEIEVSFLKSFNHGIDGPHGKTKAFLKSLPWILCVQW
jgi:hypothetical protein